MLPKMDWVIKNQDVPSDSDDLIDTLLSLRDITTPEQKDLFFNTSTQDIIEDLVGLFDSTVIFQILSTIKETIKDEKPIFIHGDYDVDGISGTAILWETIYRDLGYKNVHPFIPHRVDHGYGVSTESVDDISSQMSEPGLVITVDCGITGKNAISYGQEKGLEFIVTDHHTVQEEKVPDDVPIMHTYELCGAGIAWVLSLLLKQDILEADISDGKIFNSGLDLVALATLADIQSLVGYNRVLVKEGLRLLSDTQRVGLQALYKEAGIEKKSIGTYEVGWVIGPRINAMGRLEHALDSLRLLCTTNISQANDLAKLMGDTNSSRQEMTQSAIDLAVDLVTNNGWQNDLILVVYDESWHEGILGLIAGKLVERFGVPVVALGPGDGLLKGSARSVSGFNIAQALKQNEDLLIDTGGHEMAAGLSMEEKNVNPLREKLQENAADAFQGEKPQKVLKIDSQLSPQLLNMETVKAIETLAPHGVGNPRPVFMISNAVIMSKKIIGKSGNHLKLDIGFVDSNGQKIEAVAFNFGEVHDELDLGSSVDVAFTLEINDYFDTPSVQLKVKDIKSNKQ